MTDLPIACGLTPTELAVRKESLIAELMRRCSSLRKVENGLLLSLDGSPESIGLAIRAIEAERKCCRFLTFQLRFSQDLGPVELEITGPVGTQEFLASLLGEPRS